MKIVILEDFNRFDGTLSVKYFPENNRDDLGIIKISHDGTVLDSHKTNADNNSSDAYFNIVKTHLAQMFMVDPLPYKSEIRF